MLLGSQGEIFKAILSPWKPAYNASLLHVWWDKLTINSDVGTKHTMLWNFCTAQWRPALNAVHTFHIDVYGGIINAYTENYCPFPAISDNGAVLRVIHWLRWPFYFQVIPTYQPTSVVGNTEDHYVVQIFLPWKIIMQKFLCTKIS